MHYTGTLEDGTEFDSSRTRDPLEFVVGGGSVIAGFDQAVLGLRVGDSRTHAVKPADGYGTQPLSPSLPCKIYEATSLLSSHLKLRARAGEWREEMLAKIPTKDLNLDAELDVGTRLRLSNGLEAVVHEKTEDAITIDANPPLAGKTLQFDVELVDLTKVILLSFQMADFFAWWLTYGCLNWDI